MLKLCGLKAKFQKLPPFWLNKKWDFSKEVLGPPPLGGGGGLV